MLAVGTKAPDFTLNDQNGAEVRLSDFLGRKVVLYFYPKDNTPGCTRQACAFAGSYTAFQEQDVAVIGTGASFISELSGVPLTSIYLPAREYAQRACDIALERMNTGTAPEKRVPEKIRTGIFFGGSCGCSPAELPQMYWEAVPMSLEDQEFEICESTRFDQFMKYVIF